MSIRWPSFGRSAAIAGAIVLAIVSLPALLGGGDPPPLPPDVGLTSTGPAPGPSPPVEAAGVDATPPPAASPPAHLVKRPHGHSRPKRAHRGVNHSDRHRADRADRQSDHVQATPPTAPAASYQPTPAYPAPSHTSEGFSFER
jgi:hypothetical protein